MMSVLLATVDISRPIASSDVACNLANSLLDIKNQLLSSSLGCFVSCIGSFDTSNKSQAVVTGYQCLIGSILHIRDKIGQSQLQNGVGRCICLKIVYQCKNLHEIQWRCCAICTDTRCVSNSRKSETTWMSK